MSAFDEDENKRLMIKRKTKFKILLSPRSLVI